MSGCLIGSLFFEVSLLCFSFFFFNDTATTEIYTLSLHDALPILGTSSEQVTDEMPEPAGRFESVARFRSDRKSTRLNSSHGYISYAVFCLKKKKNKQEDQCAVTGWSRTLRDSSRRDRLSVVALQS